MDGALTSRSLTHKLLGSGAQRINRDAAGEHFAGELRVGSYGPATVAGARVRCRKARRWA